MSLICLPSAGSLRSLADPISPRLCCCCLSSLWLQCAAQGQKNWHVVSRKPCFMIYNLRPALPSTRQSLTMWWIRTGPTCDPVCARCLVQSRCRMHCCDRGTVRVPKQAFHLVSCQLLFAPVVFSHEKLFCVWSRIGQRWPDGPHPSGVAHGCSLIPVSGVGVVVDEVKTRGNGVKSRTPRNDRVADGMTSETHTKDRSNSLSQCKCIGWIVRSVARNEKHVGMRAFGEVLSVHTPSRQWRLLLSGREIC